MIDRLISELMRGEYRHIKGINHNFIFDPVRKNIIRAIEKLHSEDMQTSKGYVIDAFQKSKTAKYQVQEANKIMTECEDIFVPVVGDCNESLRLEYINTVLGQISVHIEDTQIPPEQRVKNIEEKLKVLKDDAMRKYEFLLSDKINEYVENYGKGNSSRGSIPVYLSHYQRLFGTELRPFFYAIGARPGAGKTTMLRDLESDWLRRGHNGLTFSQEDNSDTCTEKIVAPYYGIPREEIQKESIRDKSRIELMKLDRPKGELIIVDKIVNRKEMSAIMEKHASKIDWVSLDYLQIIARDNGKTHEEIGLFTREIMQVCKEYRKPFIALTQLNRNAEKENREPMMSDLKDSGSIEQDARFVVGLWKHHATVMKNTWGKLFSVNLEWDYPKGRLLGVGEFKPQETENQRGRK